MSRFFEFVKHVHGQTPDFSSASQPALSEADQILSVLCPVQPETRSDGGPPGAAFEYPDEHLRISPECRIIFHSDPSNPAADRFRYLRMRLRELSGTGKLKTILITSALPQDGKSTIALNLATALAERGTRRVLLLDGDLHHASLGRLLGLPPSPGLAECIARTAVPQSCVRRVGPLGWWLLPAGERPEQPTELLQSDLLSVVIGGLSSQFDWVVIDSPPVLSVTDALSLAQHADGALVVARTGRTPRVAVENALALLGRRKLVGIVLNEAEQIGGAYSSREPYYRAASVQSASTAAAG